MLRIRSQVENKILQTSCLTGRPMNTRYIVACRHTRQVKDKIPHLTQEDIGAAPVQVCREVWIAINEPEALKVSGGFQNRWVIRISDKLREVVVDDGGREEIGASREINHSRSGTSRSTTFPTAASDRDRCIDSCCVICDSIA